LRNAASILSFGVSPFVDHVDHSMHEERAIDDGDDDEDDDQP